MSLFKKIFGGSTQKSLSTSTSTSMNQAFPWLMGNIGPSALYNYNDSTSHLNDVFAGGFDDYKKQIGYDFLMDEGIDKVGGAFSGKGVYNSGAAGKALTQYGQNLNKTTYNDFIDRLLGRAQVGLGGANAISGAGGFARSDSQSSGIGNSTPGIAGFIGTLLGAAAKGGAG